MGREVTLEGCLHKIINKNYMIVLQAVWIPYPRICLQYILLRKQNSSKGYIINYIHHVQIDKRNIIDIHTYCTWNIEDVQLKGGPITR